MICLRVGKIIQVCETKLKKATYWQDYLNLLGAHIGTLIVFTGYR